MVHVNFWAFLFSCVFFLQRIFPQSIAYCACYVKQWMPWTLELRVGGMDFLGIALEKKWGSVLKRFFNLISRGWDFLICLKDKHFSVQKYVILGEKRSDLKSEGFVWGHLPGVVSTHDFCQLCCFFKIFWPFRNFLPILNNAGHHGSKYASCLWRMRVEAPGILENKKNRLGNLEADTEVGNAARYSTGRGGRGRGRGKVKVRGCSCRSPLAGGDVYQQALAT